jgi:AmmeMemoRadiSam system protein B
MNAAGPKLRPPAVAGRFYDRDPARCAAAAAACCAARTKVSLPPRLFGGVVPHAGWVCSGAVAGETLSALAARTEAKTVVLTGSVHTMAIWNPALETADAWQTPLGAVEIDHELRGAIGRIAGFGVMDMAHENEHSLEVELPLMITAFGRGVKIVPVLIPPAGEAVAWGEAIGGLLRKWREPAVMVCSTDFTHYGPSYRFTPRGVGPEAIRWAHGENDRRLLDLVKAMDAEAIVPEVASRSNACGAGALAATVACCRMMGATAGHELAHMNSQEVLAPLGHADGLNSVGYAGIVFG